MTSSYTAMASPADLLGRPLNAREQKHAPEELWVSGRPNLFHGRFAVSVVGARRVSAEGARRAKKLTTELVREGVLVVSGLAAGTDTAVHKAAIAAGGMTVAVLGTPLDDYYPFSNRELQQAIARDHLLVSQFPAGSPISKGNFPQRNRTMALLTSVTIIVEAEDGSGTLHQAWEALRLDRTLFILQSAAERSDLTWPKELVKYGAEVLADSGQVFAHAPHAPDVGQASVAF